MHPALIIAGFGLVVAGLLLVRHHVAFARSEIAYRIRVLRSSSLMNSEYVEREVDALRTSDSLRLSGWLTAGFGGLLAAFGVLVALRGLR